MTLMVVRSVDWTGVVLTEFRMFKLQNKKESIVRTYMSLARVLRPILF